MRIPLKLVLAAACAALVATPVTGAAAEPGNQPTDHGHLIIEPGSPTGDPANAIAAGFWGHEGSAHDQASAVMADLSDTKGKVTEASQAAWIDQFGTTDFNSVGIAFVKASDDGSAERPEVEEGQNAGQVFEWFTTASLGGTWIGSNADPRQDVVVAVSTLAEYEAWIEDGKPDQVPNDDLEMVDALEPDAPVADYPLGTSIQNRWPAGEEVSMVAFRYDGFDANGIPVVFRGKDGHAVTASLTFKTVADPEDPDVKTSAGYEVLGTSDLPAEGGKGGAGDQSGKGDKVDKGDGTQAGDNTQTDTDLDADTTTPPTAAPDLPQEKAWSNLWTGSGWAMPLFALALVLAAVLAGGTRLLRDKSNGTTR